jgi:adenosylcobyric acid synthase
MKAKTDFLLDVAVIGFPHISNFDDFDPLKREPGVRLRYVESNDTLGSPDLVILPGTKTTMADLAWLRERGFAGEIRQLSRNGAAVIGICGGYQMLGERVLDPEGVESSQSEMEGLGLLPVTTIFAGTKETHRVRGEVGEAPGILEGAAGLSVEGYEIHMGRSFYSDYSDGSHHPGPSSCETAQRPARHSRESGNSPINITQRSGNPVDGPDGAIDPAGRIFGTYIHGLFHNPGLRRAILHRLARWKGVTLPEDMESNSRDEEYDKLAALVRRSLDMESIYRMTGLEVSGQ